jgi:hypothetical protein
MKKLLIILALYVLAGNTAFAQQQPSQIKVYPKEIFDVLNNPGIGFTTFQRFNGDQQSRINWSAGYTFKYEPFNGNLTNRNYPQSSIAYLREYWIFFEPEEGKYNWDMLDKALRMAADRGQTLMFRIMPYGTNNVTDVPPWFREMVGKEKPDPADKRVDHEDPRYLHYFGRMIAALGQRYDGHPDLESVDISITGPWGEGRGTGHLSEKARSVLINSYVDNFKKTPLHFLPNSEGADPALQVKGTNIAASWPDGRNNGTGEQMRYVGYRFDCWGDYYIDGSVKNNWDGVNNTWSHMRDHYPREIINMGLADAWKKAPITFEICWTFMHWLERLKFDEKLVSYIFDEALKLHISSFNAKSSPVPDAWMPLVDKWLNKMGYRFVVRQVIYPSFVVRQGQLSFKSLWENIGVAPIYKDYQLAVRLRNAQKTIVLPVNANIREWLPGNIVCDDKLFIPHDAPLGKYQLEIAIVTPVSFDPRVKLAIEGRTKDGWYGIGEIEIREAIVN